ncbi:MAG: hypothetical protein AAGJ35_07340, partial [Myxococcota bacterium]
PPPNWVPNPAVDPTIDMDDIDDLDNDDNEATMLNVDKSILDNHPPPSSIVQAKAPAIGVHDAQEMVANQEDIDTVDKNNHMQNASSQPRTPKSPDVAQTINTSPIAPFSDPLDSFSDLSDDLDFDPSPNKKLILLGAIGTATLLLLAILFLILR